MVLAGERIDARVDFGDTGEAAIEVTNTTAGRTAVVGSARV
jgi:hypothetical protein